MIHEFELKLKIIKHDRPYTSPINTKYATAMREIYEGRLFHEVAKANGIYSGAISKKVIKMRQLFESLSNKKYLPDDMAGKFKSITKNLREIGKMMFQC
uniref:Transposase n=1 Tax=Strongyloides venezuelensis TaxID=75913 RepID=A0A0K0FFN8_STRVS